MTTSSADVCVVGAGPHGLAITAHLLTARRALRVTVVDPAGAWLTTWRDQFARLDISVLRSAMVHHPGVDPGGLGTFTRRRNRPTSGLPYGVPLASVFEEYCAELVDGLDLASVVVADRVERVDEDGTVTTATATFRAERVVIASNHSRPHVPRAFADALVTSDRVVHSADVDLRSLRDLTGERIVVVGGGMTAGHLACGALARGADVVQLVRRPIAVRDFDVEPGWLGPRELDRFGAERDPARRLALAVEARGGGSVPPWMHAALAAHVDAGRLRHLVGDTEAIDVATDVAIGADHVSLTLTGADGEPVPIEADRCWLATGRTPQLDPALDHVGVDTVDGYPVLDPTLRVRGTRIHIVGRLAAPTIGPAAGNLWGARVAARHITRAITDVDLDHDAIVRIPAPTR